MLVWKCKNSLPADAKKKNFATPMARKIAKICSAASPNQVGGSVQNELKIRATPTLQFERRVNNH